MSCFYVKDRLLINKSYEDLFKDLISFEDSDIYIKEANTYSFFVELTR